MAERHYLNHQAQCHAPLPDLSSRKVRSLTMARAARQRGNGEARPAGYDAAGQMPMGKVFTAMPRASASALSALFARATARFFEMRKPCDKARGRAKLHENRGRRPTRKGVKRAGIAACAAI
jgi:hypothetical protein